MNRLRLAQLLAGYIPRLNREAMGSGCQSKGAIYKVGRVILEHKLMV